MAGGMAHAPPSPVRIITLSTEAIKHLWKIKDDR